MDAAIKKLDDVGTLLTAAGEGRLAADAADYHRHRAICLQLTPGVGW